MMGLACDSACLPRADFDNAEGRIAGELLCPYPPGIPVVLPGERITTDALRLLDEVKGAGGKVMGCADDTMRTILTVVE